MCASLTISHSSHELVSAWDAGGLDTVFLSARSAKGELVRKPLRDFLACVPLTLTLSFRNSSGFYFEGHKLLAQSMRKKYQEEKLNATMMRYSQ